MKIGDNIKDIREFEKNFKRTYVADKLGITERAYANIENNVADITLSRLKEIAEIFECSPEFIINYKQSKKDFYNYFHNNDGNKGVNIMHQGYQNEHHNQMEELWKELLNSERKRITMLENLLKQNNIDF